MASESGYSQTIRQIAVSTPLGDDVLLLRRATFTERLSTLFECQLELLSEDSHISPDSLLGQPVTVRLHVQDDSERFINGLVSRFSFVGFEGRLARYQATLVPWLWLLTRTSDCRIFQKMSILDIIKEVLGEYGFPLEERLYEASEFRKLEDDQICVQYRETDFNFVSRLMESEGIYYFFEHEDGQHTLVLADSYSSHHAAPGCGTIPFHADDLASSREQDFIFDWSLSSAIRPGAFVHDDFDFKHPGGELRTSSEIARQHAHANLEIYDYPGEYVGTSTGERYASVRMQELQADHEIARADGYARGVSVGSLFTLSEYPRDDQNREYLIISAQHQLQTDEFQTSGSPAANQVYRSSFEAMDAHEVFRPQRLTPKPIVQGPQTAIVVGEAGEEISTDQYGRVKVQFHWDRYGKMNENSCCFIRVSNGWAGKNWGAIHIPRIGQEVIVSFLEGDPDQPMVTGRVYNGAMMPPYELPGEAVISGIKSNSTKGGDGYNEYVFDDTKGNELIREHGEFDKDSTIDNDLREHVLRDRSRDVSRNESVQVGNNRRKSIGNDERTSVGRHRTESVGKNETISIGENRTESVGKDETISVGDNRTESVGKNESITVGKNRTENVGKDETVQIGEDRAHSVAKNDTLNVGKNLAIVAGDQIVIKTGSSSITMKKDGTILIKGKDITVQGSGKINMKASSAITMKGSKINQN